MATKKHSNIPRSVAHRDGRALAVQLLEEFEVEGAGDRCAIEPQYWADGATQELPLLRYLQILRKCNSPEVDCGFCEVLMDFIACSADGGGAPSPTFYAKFIDGPQPAKGATA